MALPRLARLLAICLVIFRATFAAAQTPPIATVGLTAGWATFGQAVPQGSAHDGLRVGNLATQTDVKNRWPDGSIRFAIVTARVPSAGVFTVVPAPPSTGAFGPSWPGASVTLVINGITYSAVLPNALPEDTWLSGPLVHEGRHLVTPITLASGAAHPFIRVNFDTRAYNDGNARLDISVENVLDAAEATTVTYDVTIRINGQAVFTKNSVQHFYLTRWRKVFTTGSTVLASITPDLAPFYASGALPSYMSQVGNVVSTPAGPNYDLLRAGALQPNMPDEGTRPELAPYPDWTARYLVHRDATQRSFVLANGDLSGSWPIHVRETETSGTSGVGAERLVSIEQRPAIWLGDRTEGAAWDAIKGAPLPLRAPGIPAAGPGQSELVPDNAHQPSLAYVPYLMTGDRYYAEEMAFWANYAMVRTDPGDGIRGSLGILANNEVRGYGWALRNLVDAASYYPDASPVKAYLSRKVTSNLQWLNAYAAAQNPNINPFQILWINKQSEGGQYIAPWEQSYLAHAIDRANQQGFAGGLAHRDAIARLQLRLFASEPDYPREYGSPHLLAVGTANASDPATLAAFDTTMSQIWSGTIGQERPFAGFYGAEARLNLLLGVQNAWPGAQEADAYLWPFISSELALRAGWAIGAPPSAVSSDTLAATSSKIIELEATQPEAGIMSTLPEGIPDFSGDLTRPHIASVQSGNWSSAATWGGQIPTLNHVVRIGQGHTVTITDTAAVAYTIAVDGTLAFAPNISTRLTVTNLEVMAGSDGMGTPGSLEVGTAAAPIAAGVTAEIVISNSPLGGGVPDPEQFGTGVIVFGKVSMHGSVKTPTFVRLATEPLAGNTTLTLSQAVLGWRPGDRLVLPDTRHIKESETVPSGWTNLINQWEELTLQSVSADGLTLTLTSALQYDHLGARDLNGVLEFLPHVGNLTRNVIVRSASPTGTRGHVIFTHMADVDIRYALYKDLGRTTYLPLDATTNHIGRYPIHAHHLFGSLPTPANGFQFTLLGNAVDGGSAVTQFKWGIAIHGSHYGLIQDNVVYNLNGAAIATEDGSESFNVFDHNFVLRGMGQPNDALGEARMALGTEAVGFWFKGPNNYVTNNVAANFQNPSTEAAYGFVYQFRYLGNIEVPNFKGADTMGTMGPGQSTTMNGNNMPLLQFENNEAYGAMQGGFTFWWIGSQDPQPFAGQIESVVKNLRIWHVYNKGVYAYPGQKVTFDGLKIRGNYTALSRSSGDGVFFADYMSKDIVIRNSDIQGMQQGIIAPMSGFGPNPNLTVRDSYLRNWENVVVPTVGAVNGCWMDDKLVTLVNTRFDVSPGQAANHIVMVRDVAHAPECPAKLDQVRVYAYNGIAADNFQVYHPASDVLPRPPVGCTPTTLPGVNGPICGIAPLTPVPTASLNVGPSTIDSGQSATLMWSTADATTVFIDHMIGFVPASGTLTVSPTLTSQYILTATGTTGLVTATTTLTVRIPVPITWNAPPNIVYGTPLSATQLNATVEGTTVAGTFAYTPGSGTILPAGTHPLSVTFSPTDTAHFITSTKSVPIIVSKATPVIAWTPPAPIISGTALGATQLNAGATAQGTTVPGTFAYTPGSGTILAPGTHTLSVVFTPTDTNNYDSATASVSITVKETPIISWTPPANITYGTPLSAVQLNASATVAGINVQGTFAYTPAAGAILNAGTQTLSVIFTPTDQAGYVLSNASVPITVVKATPVLTWALPANIVYGTPLGAALNASTSVASQAPVYTRDSGPVVTAGTVLTAGVHTLSVTFTPTDTANYFTATASVPITVAQATPVISWATPANIVVGTALGPAQLNATVASPPGGLSYSPNTGHVFGIGAAQLLSVTFTPTDQLNYTTASKTVPITVTAAGTTPPVTAPVKIGNQISGTFKDATGHSGQSHLVYAPNAGVWWFFTLSSASDAPNNQRVQVYVSSGPDLGSATWTAGTVSPNLPRVNSPNALLAGSRSLGVAIRSIGSADYAHVFASAAFDGQTSQNGHIRAQLGTTSITWDAWNNPGSPNTASQYQGPTGTGGSGGSAKTPWGNSVGISSSGYVHHFSVVMDQEVDCNVGRSTDPDISATWINGFGSNVSPTGNTGSSPPWTTAVIDKTMTNECKVLSFAPLASDVMLAVYSNGNAAQPNLTNLRSMRSGANGTWTNVPFDGDGGNGEIVFSTNATINQNDWALVPVSPTTVYAFRKNGNTNAVNGASYSAASDIWSPMTGATAPPPFGTSQTFKATAGLFGATDGTSVWLFVINGHASDAANSILFTKFSGGSWTPWAIVPGTNTGTHVRNFISGYQKPNASGQIGLAWTEGSSTFDVFTTALNATGGPTPSATITAPAAASTVSGATVTVSATATPGSGTVAGVQFILDGVNLGAEDTSSPYEVSWDTTTVPNGTHFLSAVARDSNGGTGPGNTITVTVLNGGASPTIAITTPSSGATVSGTLVVAADAADDNGVAGVQFLLDGQPLGAEVTTAPYYVSWNTSAVAAGPHTLAARARDTAGKLTTSAAVNVTKLIVTPIITWPAPAPVFHLTALGPQQLNATTTVPGTFTYLPAAGTVLPVGTGQSLSVTFTPADAINYTTAAAAVSITVIDKTAPSVTPPAPISVPATEMSGARGNVVGSVGSQSLNAFLSAGSAADAGDAAPVRLPTEAMINGTWTPVAADTLFPKDNTTVRFSFRDASGNTGSSTSVVTVTGRIADEPTINSAVGIGGARLQALQNPDGGWPFRVVGAGCAGTYGTCPNTFGVIGLGLLAADRHTGGTALRPAAIAAGDALLARYQAALLQTPQQLPHNQDIEFLVELSALTGNPVYATTAKAWFQIAIARFPIAGARIDDFIARRDPGKLRSVAAWDAASFIRAAKAAGELDYALAAAVRTRDLEYRWKDTDPAHRFGACGNPSGCGPPDNPQSFKYTILGEGSLLWAIHDLPGFEAQVNEYRAFLLAQQDPAGSWDGGDSQVTAYVTIGLQAVGGTGTSAAMTAAANFFLAQQLPTFGWPFSASTAGEYGAVDGEVVRAISTLFSTRAGANVEVAPAQLSNVTFSTVTTSGVTTVVAIQPETAPSVIGGFQVVGGLTYQVNTTAAISGNIIVCFSVPWITDATTFDAVRIMHGESGVMVDRTIVAPDQPAPDFATRRVCARTTSLSPFAVALALPDDTAPALTVPADATIEATGPQGAAHAFTALATDDVDGTFAATCVPASGATFAFGATMVTCGAADAAGNAATPVTFSVRVIDTTPPVVTVPADVTIEATGPLGTTHPFAASASDVVDGTVAATCSAASGARFALGSTTVTCGAADAAGNAAAPKTFTVRVIDTTPPVVTVPANVTIDRAPVKYTFTASATDAVNGGLVPVCTPPSGTRFAVGTTTVTCQATDARGNVGSAAFTVTVKTGRRRIDTVPKAISESYRMKANTVLTGFLKGRDADGDPLTFQLVKNESGGKVVIDPRTGAFSYTPKKRADDHDSFTFRVTDGKHWSHAARVEVEVSNQGGRDRDR